MKNINLMAKYIEEETSLIRRNKKASFFKLAKSTTSQLVGSIVIITLAGLITQGVFINNGQACGSTIVVQKIIDQDGDLGTTDDQTPGEGWSFKVASSSRTTNSDGYTNPVTVNSGTYSVSETLQDGYSLIDAYCTGAQNNGELSGNTISCIKVGSHDKVSCIFYNAPLPGTLIVRKNIINDNQGSKQAQDFSFVVNDGQPIAFEADGENQLTVNAGAYNISEPETQGYTTSYENCSGIQILNGGQATCTITNDDIVPPPQPQADVAVTKSVDDQTVDPDQTITFTITVTNLGPDQASAIILIDTLDVGLNFVSATSSQGDYATSTGQWNIGDLAKDGSATLQIQVIVQGQAGQTLTNNAAVTLAIDPNTSNNSASASVTINTPPPPPGPSEPVIVPGEGVGGGGADYSYLPPSDAYQDWLKQQAAQPTPAPAEEVPVEITPPPAPEGEVKGEAVFLPPTGFDAREALPLIALVLTLIGLMLVIKGIAGFNQFSIQD